MDKFKIGGAGAYPCLLVMSEKNYTVVSLDDSTVRGVSREEAYEMSSYDAYVILTPAGDLLFDGEVQKVDRS